MEKRIDKLKTELRKLGFITEETEDTEWHSFMYSDLTFRFTVDERLDLLAIGVAFYQEHTDVERGRILEVINRFNDRMNFVKVIEVGDVLWLTYEMDVERRMPDEEDLRKMITLLTGGYYHLTSLYAELVGPPEDGREKGETETEPGAFDWDGYVSDEKGADNDDGR